jgi:segregation and condensation protein A
VPAGAERRAPDRGRPGYRRSVQPSLTEQDQSFQVHLEVFEGPFDLLLGLIAKHRLDVTTVALSRVTDEFIAYLRTPGRRDLDQVSDFLVVAATLLDLKAARLLPAGEPEDEEDLARLEARDLLFARLLAYRAFRDAAAVLGARLDAEAGRFPRAVGLEPAYAALLPELVLDLSPAALAALAARALTPRPAPQLDLDHLHVPRASVAEQSAIVAERLHRVSSCSFRALRADAASLAEVVARFLALLELYREGRISFEQAGPLGDLVIRWRGEGAADGE